MHYCREKMDDLYFLGDAMTKSGKSVQRAEQILKKSVQRAEQMEHKEGEHHTGLLPW